MNGIDISDIQDYIQSDKTTSEEEESFEDWKPKLEEQV